MSAKCQKQTLQPSPYQTSEAMLVIQAVAARIEGVLLHLKVSSVFERLADDARGRAY
jgi:hypothetical protein